MRCRHTPCRSNFSNQLSNKSRITCAYFTVSIYLLFHIGIFIAVMRCVIRFEKIFSPPYSKKEEVSIHFSNRRRTITILIYFIIFQFLEQLTTNGFEVLLVIYLLCGSMVDVVCIGLWSSDVKTR